MKPAGESYTVAMPWYERVDFEELWALAIDHPGDKPDYDRWHAEATRVLNEHLARGKALQIITIKPKAYLEWLGGAPNCSAMRRTYVEYLAAGAVRQRAAEPAE